MKFLNYKKIFSFFLIFISIIVFIRAEETVHKDNLKKEKISKEKSSAALILTPAEKKWIDQNKELRVVITGNSAPIQFFSLDGKFRGIAIDYLDFLAKRIGFSIKLIKADDVNDALDLIKKKKADLIIAVTPTPERFKFMDFSSPYLEMNPVIIVRKGEGDNLALDSLNKHKVAIVKDSAIGEFVKFNYPNIDLTFVPTPYAGLTLVSTGGASAFISNMLEASYYIESEGIINLKVAGKTDYITRITFGIRKDAPLLVSVLNKGIAATTELEKKKIISQWTSFNSTHVYGEEFWVVLLIISGTLLGVFILIIVWNLSLKKQVIARTKELVNELAERQKAEKEITKYRDHLEELVKKRTATLNETNEKLKEEIKERKKVETALSEAKEIAENANMAKSLFLANMSHEIRTPMNVILGFSQLLCRDKTITGEQRQNLETIDRSGKHLLKLIDQILEMTKIEAGKLTLNEEIFDFYTMLADLEIMFNIRAIDNKLLFSIDYDRSIPKYLIGDAGKIRQVLVNLLGNAIKYTEDGYVKMAVTFLTEENKCVKIKFSVQDTGQGINEDEENKLFSAFTQTKSGIKGGKGTGLGLAISQRYIRLMGSEIKFCRREPKGSEFSFELELKKGEAGEIEKIKTDLPKQVLILKKKHFGKYKILLCEDEKENRELVSRLLTDIGFIVETANNGREGIELIHNYKPDLILLDLRMPVMDGYEAIEKIREDEKFSELPVFAVTANVFDEDKTKVLKAGFNEFMGKPIDDNKLLLLIKQYLKVEYIYDEIDSVEEDNEQKTGNSEDSFCEIPEDLKASLIYAIETADYDRICIELDKFKEVNRKYAKKLMTYAESFDYQKMLKILNEN